MFEYRPICKFLAITSLFFIQLHLFQYWQYQTPHLLLIYFLHALYEQYSTIELVYTATLGELLSFLQTGFLGLTVAPFLLLSFMFDALKQYFQIQIIVPCILITIFQLLYLFCIVYILHVIIPPHVLAQQILMNSFGYILVHFIKI